MKEILENKFFIHVIVSHLSRVIFMDDLNDERTLPRFNSPFNYLHSDLIFA